MENSNAHRPVPATEEIIAKLSREVLEVGCTPRYDCFNTLPAHKDGLQRLR
jgi:E3 ubiquitin-protein ligase RNF115/126